MLMDKSEYPSDMKNPYLEDFKSSYYQAMSAEEKIFWRPKFMMRAKVWEYFQEHMHEVVPLYIQYKDYPRSLALEVLSHISGGLSDLKLDYGYENDVDLVVYQLYQQLIDNATEV